MRYGHTSGVSQDCRFPGFLAIGLIFIPLLVACGSETKPLTGYDEVVARVNGEEITVHQLNERLAQIGPPTEADPGAVRKQLLDILIDERLLVQKAIARGLDKDPATRNAIERSRMQLLAQAAIDGAGDPAVNEKEARAFYRANPDLFGARKVYTFRRFLMASGKLDGPVKAELDAARTGADVAAVLKAADLPYTQVTELRTAESLPASILVQAARMASGDILLFPEGSRTTLLQLVGSVTEPVSLEAAIPSILEYLGYARHQKNADQLVKDLRRKAKVEYVTQTAKSSIPTALAEGKPVRGEPPLKKSLQSQQITVVRSWNYAE